MIDEKFNLIKSIDLVDSTIKDIREFLEVKSSEISSSLNETCLDYKVVTDWSIDPFVSPTLVSVSIYIDVNGLRAFVDKLYAEDLSRSFETESLISKCDKVYRHYFVD